MQHALFDPESVLCCCMCGLCRHWQCPLHGMRGSALSALAMAFDDSCLISAARDGSLLLLSNPLQQQSPGGSAVQQAPQLSSMAADAAAAGGQADAPDLQADALSLEEARQAAQHSQQAAAAAAAREQLVAAVAVLRREHAALVAENSAWPPGQQLPRHMLEIDAGKPSRVDVRRPSATSQLHSSA
jgi:Ni/Co efflux regulator RcnB